MSMMAPQITSLTIVYPNVYSGVDRRKHQSSMSLAFVWGIHRSPVNSPHKWPVTRKMFPFDDVTMLIIAILYPIQCYTGPWYIDICWYTIYWVLKIYQKTSVLSRVTVGNILAEPLRACDNEITVDPNRYQALQQHCVSCHVKNDGRRSMYSTYDKIYLFLPLRSMQNEKVQDS